jgi:hypothetical protein
MTHEQIEEIVQKKQKGTLTFNIRFKTRNPIKGMFIKTADYAELSRKNLWRIVSESNISSYNSSRDENLARIFNGTEFTKLEAAND